MPPSEGIVGDAYHTTTRIKGATIGIIIIIATIANLTIPVLIRVLQVEGLRMHHHRLILRAYRRILRAYRRILHTHQLALHRSLVLK
jgi:hypothetical protein